MANLSYATDEIEWLHDSMMHCSDRLRDALANSDAAGIVRHVEAVAKKLDELIAGAADTLAGVGIEQLSDDSGAPLPYGGDETYPEDWRTSKQ